MRIPETLAALTAVLLGVASVASLGAGAEDAAVMPSEKEIRSLERRVKLPPAATALRTYVRYYYATVDSGPIGRAIEGIYVAKSWFRPSELPPTDVVVVGAETDVSVPADAKCALIFVTYTPANNTAVASCSATLKLQTVPMPAEPLSRALHGTWMLQSRIDVIASGQRKPDPLLGEDPVAILIYDDTGHFSAQFMKRDRSSPTQEVLGSANNNTQARGGYDAYFGTYIVDDAAGTVTQRLLGSVSPANVGMVLTRAVEVTGDTLIIRLETNAHDGTPVTRTLTWRRLGNAA